LFCVRKVFILKDFFGMRSWLNEGSSLSRQTYFIRSLWTPLNFFYDIKFFFSLMNNYESLWFFLWDIILGIHLILKFHKILFHLKWKQMENLVLWRNVLISIKIFHFFFNMNQSWNWFLLVLYQRFEELNTKVIYFHISSFEVSCAQDIGSFGVFIVMVLTFGLRFFTLLWSTFHSRFSLMIKLWTWDYTWYYVHEQLIFWKFWNDLPNKIK